jgi:hypothetical protein
MIKNLSLLLAISSLLCCNPLKSHDPEPDSHIYRIGKTHRNTGPYVWNSTINIDDPTGKSMRGHVYSADPKLSMIRVTNQVVEVSKYVTNSLSALGQDQCPTESILNVYFVPKDTINDPEKMAFLTEPGITNHKTFFGLTTTPMPFPITSSYLCSDCEEIGQGELIAHELAHAWLRLCGDDEFSFSEEIPEKLEADYSKRSLQGEP